MGWYQGYGRYYRDEETGLCYALLRYYAPSIGRFTTIDPAGGWYDYTAAGNGYTYVGNSYRNDFDPAGLAGTCPCGQQYAIQVLNIYPFPMIKWGSNTAAADNVLQIRQAVEKKYSTKGHTYGFGPDNKHPLNSERYAAFVKDLAKAKTDPCFKGLFLAAHGEDGKVNLFTDYPWFNAKSLVSGLDHKLDFVILYTCQGLEDDGDPQFDWDDAVSTADAAMGVEEDLEESILFHTNSDDLADRAERFLKGVTPTTR